MRLQVNSTIYEGFESLTLRSSMETITDSFEVVANNRWIGTKEIRVNDECSILDIDGTPLLTGYITEIGAEIGQKIRIKGFDKTIDLVDCTVAGSSEFQALTLDRIVESICEPFDISTSGEQGKLINLYHYDIEESAADIIRDLVTRQGYIARSDGLGNVVIDELTTTNKATFVLVEGNNIIEGTASINSRGQHSDYFVLGQSISDNTVNSSYHGESPRYRPLTTINSGTMQIADAETSSEWLGRVRDGSVSTYNITVADIQDVRPNMLIDVDAPSLGVNDELLIRSVTKVIGKKSRTHMVLSAPYMFGGDYVGNDYLL